MSLIDFDGIKEIYYQHLSLIDSMAVFYGTTNTYIRGLLYITSFSPLYFLSLSPIGFCITGIFFSFLLILRNHYQMFEHRYQLILTEIKKNDVMINDDKTPSDMETDLAIAEFQKTMLAMQNFTKQFVEDSILETTAKAI